jgi:hypothetical protein
MLNSRAKCQAENYTDITNKQVSGLFIVVDNLTALTNTSTNDLSTLDTQNMTLTL